jgi:hypothetical protein
MVAALLIGFVYTVIVMKLSLTTGLTPTMNVSAALLAFLALRGWTRALGRLGIACRPFTRQENTVVQTCVVACYTIGFGGKPVRDDFLACQSTSPPAVAIDHLGNPQVGSGRSCWAWTRRRTSSPG